MGRGGEVNTAIKEEDWQCPKCGFDKRVLQELAQSESRTNKTLLWIITENCPECKRATGLLLDRKHNRV